MKSDQSHWENIYQTKKLDDVSWYQQIPQSSLDIIQQLQLPLHASIVDIGAGDSVLVEHLIDRGYTNLTVLDISASAIDRAKQRLGNKAELITWIVCDIRNWVVEDTFDLWHDRAAFHFLTEKSDINDYANLMSSSVNSHGNAVIATFSESGPSHCSGLPVTQYSADTMAKVFEPDFTLTSSSSIDHHTPFDTIQNFTFCVFQKVR